MEATERFSNRVDDYARYRPAYPDAAYQYIMSVTGLSPQARIADVGAGTGISTLVFLSHGHTVVAVEPNQKMADVAFQRLMRFPGFVPSLGSAENISVPSRFVDLVVAAQAFHWFDVPAAQKEFARILKPPGWVALMWNSWDPNAIPFLRAYEDLLLQYGIDYKQVDHRKVDDDKLRQMFINGYERTTLPNSQQLDLDGLKGRIRSASYMPAAGHPQFEPMMRRAEELFMAHQRDGQVRFEYETSVYVGAILASVEP